MIKQPGKKNDETKNRWDLVPFEVMDEFVKRFTHGAIKYNENPDDPNYLKLPDAKNRYFSGLCRHLSAYRQGEVFDPDAPNLTHIGAVMWNAAILCYFELEKIKLSKKDAQE